jgi:hypothetical protein
MAPAIPKKHVKMGESVAGEMALRALAGERGNPAGEASFQLAGLTATLMHSIDQGRAEIEILLEKYRYAECTPDFGCRRGVSSAF